MTNTAEQDSPNAPDNAPDKEAYNASSRRASRQRVVSLAQSGLLIALLAVSVQISVPVGPVPFTLQTFVIMLVALILPPRQAALTIVGYIALGALGAPVFSSMRGGLAVIAGPTGGYLYGFILSAFLGSLLRRAVCRPARRREASAWRRILADVAACVVALAVCYALGTVHFMVVASMGGQVRDVVSVLLVCVVPFIVPDCVKAVAAVLVANALRAGVPSIERQ